MEATPVISMSTGRTARRLGRWLALACLALAALVAAALALKFAPAPWFWLWLSWAAALFGAVPLVGESWPRAILFNLGIVLCLLAMVEAHLTLDEYTPTLTSPGFWAPDKVLGWAPGKGRQYHAFKPNPTGLFHGPRGLLFDDTYTIDASGLRIAPPWQKDDLAGTVMFFGCSFTFGEGLKDDETLPYQVGAQSGGRYRTFNFAFDGYGAHQMLAQIEYGIVRRVVDTTPQYAFYVAIPNHVWRVAGRTVWGGHAPRYVLHPDGTVDQAGFLGNRKALAERLGLTRGVGQLNKSAIYRMLSNDEARITDDDLRLYFAVVRRSQQLLAAQYPGIRFEIILWPNQDVPQQREVYEKMREEFPRMGIPVHLVEDILPGYNVYRLEYVLSPVDHHPNPLADRLLAGYVLSAISPTVR